MNFRHFTPLVLPTIIGILLLFLLSACGGDSQSGGSATSSLPAAANPTLPIRVMQVTVGTNAQTILTDARGFALYFYVPDTQTKSACTDSCAQTWPPLLASTAGDAQSASSLPGKLTVQQTANGNQVEYNEHLLYTYIGDSGPSTVTGNGVNSWYAATPDLKPPTAFRMSKRRV